jgi:hypothetical protein
VEAGIRVVTRRGGMVGKDWDSMRIGIKLTTPQASQAPPCAQDH